MIGRLSGFSAVIGATALAGVIAYVITWWVPAVIGGVDYAVFAVFWAALYLVVGALSGVQQEITRATRPIEDPHAAPAASRARNFGLVAAGITLVGVVASSPLWVDAVFDERGFELVPPLAIGSASYVLVATLSGALYGVRAWREVALLILGDAVLRLAGIGLVLAFTSDIVALAWAATLPFAVTIAGLWPVVRRAIVGRSQLDVGYGRLTRNVGGTLAASLSSAAIISGYPLFLSVTSTGESAALLATLFLTITLTRAPLIVTVMALQGYLIVRFREAGPAFLRTLAVAGGVIGGSAVVLAALAWPLGPLVFSWLFPREMVLGGGFFALLVISSALVGALYVTGSALLARSRHVAYSSGWALAAAVTVLTLLLPLDVYARVGASLLVAPVAGLVTHGLFLAAARRQRDDSTAPLRLP